MNYSTFIGKNNIKWSMGGYMGMGVEFSLLIHYMHI